MTDMALGSLTAGAQERPRCAHCGEPLRKGSEAAFCCAGCASAHAIIGAAGLGSFYRKLEDVRAHLERRGVEVSWPPYPSDSGPKIWTMPETSGGVQYQFFVRRPATEEIA